MSELSVETKYLKPYQYYSDLYDKHTVEDCRRLEKSAKSFPKKFKTKAQIEKASAIRLADTLLMKSLTGERYAQKKATIDKWMARDEKKDKIYETAQAPGNITCLTCGRLMYVESKHMWGTAKDEDKVLFFYDCPLKHIPRRAFYHDGEEWKADPHPCPKCGTELERKTIKESTKEFVFVDKCSGCGYTHEDKLGFLATKKEKIDPHFARDRARFCLSDKDGEEYIDFKYKMKGAIELMEKIQKREDNKVEIEKVAKLKNLKIMEVEQLLVPILEKRNYIKLEFQSPEIKRDVIVSFTVHDAKDRSEHVSMADLKKVLKKSLEGTNWRLMSDGVSYRLGMLSGRLRAYEREEDLIELVRDKKFS
jgi:hypothetical protein